MRTHPGTVSRTARQAGLTLVEVMIAAALLAIFVAACTAAFTLAARLQREATAIARRSAAFEPYVVATGPALSALAPCSAKVPDASAGDASGAGGATGVVCLREVDTCRIVAGALRCDGGGLWRARLAWQDPSEPGDAVLLEAWAAVTR